MYKAGDKLGVWIRIGSGGPGHVCFALVLFIIFATRDPKANRTKSKVNRTRSGPCLLLPWSCSLWGLMEGTCGMLSAGLILGLERAGACGFFLGCIYLILGLCLAGTCGGGGIAGILGLELAGICGGWVWTRRGRSRV
jgi:hypothetical protein